MHLAKFGHWPFGAAEGPMRHATSGSPLARPATKGTAMRISDFCFIFAGLAGLTGMCLGIAMGLSQDFSLAPSHAHLNLLGWVTMALYGLYHRGSGQAGGFFGWTQVVSGAVGATLMSGGLALYLGLQDEAFVPMVIIGSLLAFLGMLLFVGLALRNALRTRRPGFAAAALSG
jgi:hypothetical protein